MNKGIWIIIFIFFGFGTSCKLWRNKSSEKETQFQQERFDTQIRDQSIEQVDSIVQNKEVYRWLIFPKGAYQWTADGGIKAKDGLLIFESDKMQQLELQKQRFQIQQASEKRVLKHNLQKEIKQQEKRDTIWKIPWGLYFVMVAVILFFYIRWKWGN